MKNQWKAVRTGLLLFALPLVATAAASAHSWIIDSSPITIESNIAIAKSSAIGDARVHTVALNPNGAVEGRIASIDSDSLGTVGLVDLKIFFIQNGEVVKSTVTSEDGSFLVSDLAEGSYSFVAAGKTGFAAYGVKVVSDDSGEIENIMEAAAVSPRFDIIRKILKEELPQEVASEILEINSAAAEAPVVGSNRVLLEGGVLNGRVVALDGQSKPVAGTYVHILKDGKQVAEVKADAMGGFMVADLEPGVYAFVAAGASGFAAVSFEAVDAGSVSGLAVSGPNFPANASALPGMLEVRLTAAKDAEVVVEQLQDEEMIVDDGIVYDTMPIDYATDSIVYGGVSGGGGGGGFAGGGGGGGGFGGGVGGGRLGLVAGLALGITALASNNGSGPGPSSPSTP